MKNLLFEIGMEELPASFIVPTLDQLKLNSEKMLQESNITFEKMLTYGTPRRVSILIKGLAERQADIVEEIKGPPKRIALDSDSNLTKAGEGFLRKFSASQEDIIFKDVGNQEYLYLHNRIEGKATKTVLPEFLLSLIESLNFPKPMRWGNLETRFARPIRWLVALLDDQIIDIEYANIKSSNHTRGHRFLSTGAIIISSALDYEKLMEENFVIADIAKRENLIKSQIKDLEKKYRFKAVVKESVLAEVVNLVEYPTAFTGKFNKDYLDLPEEAVITPMQDHQRYFPTRNLNNELLPYFIGVRNGTQEHIDNVIKGNEKVLVARLADAKFFYDEDLKRPLLDYTDKLKNVVYQEEIGTVYQKVLRIEKIACKIDSLLNTQLNLVDLKTAAKLIKADLTTQMVYEFPELQGIMGHKYALAAGYSPDIARAISEHYMPTSATGDLPCSDYGAVLSIADKIDTIISCLAVGLNASGSQDPYGLRRQAAGIIRILLDKEYSLDLKELFDYSYELLNTTHIDKKTLWQELWKFFETRIRNVLDEFSYDILDSVLASNNYVISEVAKVAKAISEFKSSASYSSLIAGYKRANNLAEKAKQSLTISKDLFSEEYEIRLFSKFENIKESFNKHLVNLEYIKALEAFASLEEPINLFFDNVMVMVDDQQIKNNRFALLQNIVGMVKPIADLSLLVD